MEHSPADLRLLFVTRFLRLFAFGLLSVVLAIYLAVLGLDAPAIGLLLVVMLIGDMLLSLLLTTRADRLGRRRVLGWGAWLMLLAVLLLGAGAPYPLLVLALAVGVVSPSGAEAGPFLPLEQAALAQFVSAERRTSLLAWYHLTGAAGTALGSFCGGSLVALARTAGLDGTAAFQPVLWLYGGLALALVACFACLTNAVEVVPDIRPAPAAPRWGLHASRGTVQRLSALFALDAFGGGFVVQTVLAFWLDRRYGATPAALGLLFLCTNLLSGLSSLAAGWLARRIGLLNTMVFTHLPANGLLLLVPFAPGFSEACALLLVRSLITQMDVPTRQAYLLAVVHPDERSAAGGLTGVARSLGAALSPPATVMLAGSAAWSGLPFIVAGLLKIAYDILLYRGFRALKPAHEQSLTRRPAEH
ncbi:MAG: MFS transporter [Gammaproteobacteria bacterium]|nr:MFS transporter [Gammaproteobacteria bacterium]